MTKLFITLVMLPSGLVSLFFAASGTTPNRAITCEFRVENDLRRVALDAGYRIAQHEQLRMGARRTALADGGVEWELPPTMRNFRGELRPKDLTECDVDLCNTSASHTAACERFENAVPFLVLKSARRCVRGQKLADGGVSCRILTEDGGSAPSDSSCNGGCNVFRRTLAANPADCEPVACSIRAGDRIDSLDENSVIED